MEREKSRRSDPPTAEGCRSESTRSNSGAASSVTLRDHQNANGRCTTWTNEKHNSYLNALEALFVDQVYNSLSSKKRRVSTTLSQARSNYADYPSDQFAVLQGGFWRKKIFETDRPNPYGATASHVAVESSRLPQLLASEKLSSKLSMVSTGNHILRSDRLQLSEKMLFTNNLTSSECPFVCHLDDQDTIAILAEGSDQNFVDDFQEDKKLVRPARKD